MGAHPSILFMNAKPSALGIDIGGANLKAAHANGAALLQPFELWRRPADLSSALAELVRRFPPADRYALTMTGELCDCFETKREGVHAILDAMEAVVSRERLRVWTTAGHFVSGDEARSAYVEVAAANWHALATFGGRFAPHGSSLLVDVGSTTTDVIPLRDGVPLPKGKTDTERLRTGELLYTGGRRTSVCALVGKGVMAEVFATIRDVLLVLEFEKDDPDDRSTADGRPATRHFAHARLARMLGGDGELISPTETQAFARQVFDRQQALIVQSMREVAASLPAPIRTVILSGSSHSLAGWAWITFTADMDHFVVDAMRVIELSKEIGPSASAAACAYALAVLATEGSHAWL
jgi:(4-(4-[2-(gamma-L-glutamylamino)ethyl]phenoxymethyl)furan-2-yl)methanamine synthase